jgi:acyl-CoA thioester hydrolase
MQNIIFKGPVMWAHVDANQHMRHSAYSDFAAQARVEIFDKIGLTFYVFQEKQIGPILFREETVYLREVLLNDVLHVSCELTRVRGDGSRWSIRNEIYRNDGVKAAVVSVDGAWIDMKLRKLGKLPEQFKGSFFKIVKSEDFVEEN